MSIGVLAPPWRRPCYKARSINLLTSTTHNQLTAVATRAGEPLQKMSGSGSSSGALKRYICGSSSGSGAEYFLSAAPAPAPQIMVGKDLLIPSQTCQNLQMMRTCLSKHYATRQKTIGYRINKLSGLFVPKIEGSVWSRFSTIRSRS